MARRILVAWVVIPAVCVGTGGEASGQAYGTPDRGEPGDAMIQAYLAREAEALHARSLEGVASAEDWERRRPGYLEEYRFMLGLEPEPGRTPLEATVTGTVEGDGFVVENLHYQSIPGLYVTANLYRPAEVAEGERLPGVLYVCGHSGMGRSGNKTAFMSHGIWFARHGYVCLVVDTLQLGEIPGIHHGTYREGRWWWHSRGYTSAGVECWNGVRGIDYLVGRPDVDPDRIAVTGISGGGAATFWVAAIDDRVKVAVPVSGMADLPSYVGNRVVNGHCDCMFLYNAHRWPWDRIAGLIAPRPMLFVNSDQDPIFPMDANERVIARLERLYSHFGAGDRVDAVVSVGGHAYREDIRQSAFRFINTHLKDDPRFVADAEEDAVPESGDGRVFPIAPERLRVFPTDDDLPDDAINGEVDRLFVPMAEVAPPEAGGYDAWRDRLLSDLRRATFGALPDRIPPARWADSGGNTPDRFETEDGIAVPVRVLAAPSGGEATARVLLLVASTDEESAPPEGIARDGDAVVLLRPRGVGPTRWTQSDPPNYVARSLALLGSTVDTGRVRDVAATARALKLRFGDEAPVVVVGRGASGVIGVYAALLEPEIAGVVAVDPPASHMAADAPQFLNVLRVLDIPEAFGLLAPRPLSLRGTRAEGFDARVSAIFEASGAGDRLDRE